MKNLLCWSLAVSMVLAGCGDRKATTKSEQVGRTLASVESGAPSAMDIPVTAVNFLLNKTQNVKADQAIKTYAAILPKDIFQRMQKLSLKVDDAGFTVTRKGNMMIFKNANHELKAKLVGTAQNMMFSFEGQTYDFSKPETLNELVTLLENKVNGVNKTSFVLPFLKVCTLFPMLYTSKAQAADWFFVGGMALLAAGIAFAAYYIGKSVKNTKHEVTAKGEVGLDEASRKSLDDISKRLSEIEVKVGGDINTDHNFNVDVGDDKAVE